MDLNSYCAKPNLTIRQHTDDLLKRATLLLELGYLELRTYELLRYCCEYHDYGKMNDEFQKRVSASKKILFNDAKEVAHNVLSLCFIKKDDEFFRNLEEYHRVCYAVLNHHHYVDNTKEAEDKEALIDTFIAVHGGQPIGRRLLKKLDKQKAEFDTIRLKGLLHKCDYAASGSYEIEYPNDFLLDSLNNNLLAEWKKGNPNANWNELQQFCMQHRDQNIIAIANTGMGKTEAGLLWIGDNKGFFILPLRTAIDAIYDRVIDKIIKNEQKDTRVSLLHSDTLSYYLNKDGIEEDEILDYAKKGKHLSMPLTISTLDQLFNFVYKYNGFELKLATLGYSKIVIDEIQAYSPDLLAYLISGLEAIVKMGGKFAILTATLPPFIRDYIEENIGDIECGKFTKGATRHHLKVVERSIDAVFIADHFEEKGGKTLVICNTVKKSQEMYDELVEAFGKEKVNLIHAKFIKCDRKDKEDAIIEFGKTEKTGDEIWVATSVVEASLDIDFDYLFTELNDLNGLFQRLGRVNRKGKKEHMLEAPNCYVFTEINDNLLTNETGTRGFIDRTIYQLSKEALLTHEGQLPEGQKVEIIESTLTTGNVRDSTFHREYQKYKDYIEALYVGEMDLAKVQQMFRNIISYSVIPECVYEENEAKIKDLMAEVESPSTEYLDKVKAREKIASFTVSVGMYDLGKADRQRAMKEEFVVAKCKYSAARGFEREVVEVDEIEESGWDMFY